MFFFKGGLGVIWFFVWVCIIYDIFILYLGFYRLEIDVFLKEGVNVFKGF